jgi:hypothetical protein
VENDFRIRFCLERVFVDQFFPDPFEVVNLAVTDDSSFSAVGQNGLVPPGHIHDGESSVAEDAVSIDMNTPVVGAPMGKSIKHLLNGVNVFRTKTPCNAAHGFLLDFQVFGKLSDGSLF